MLSYVHHKICPLIPPFPLLFFFLSKCVIDLFKRKLTGTSKMHTYAISQGNVLESELFSCLTCCSLHAICHHLDVISIFKIHLI